MRPSDVLEQQASLGTRIAAGSPTVRVQPVWAVVQQTERTSCCYKQSRNQRCSWQFPPADDNDVITFTCLCPCHFNINQCQSQGCRRQLATPLHKLWISVSSCALTVPMPFTMLHAYMRVPRAHPLAQGCHAPAAAAARAVGSITQAGEVQGCPALGLVRWVGVSERSTVCWAALGCHLQLQGPRSLPPNSRAVFSGLAGWVGVSERSRVNCAALGHRL